MTKKRIVVYTSQDCTPCEEVAKLLEAGRVSNPDIDKVELVDIGTDEGFARFNEEVLLKDNGAVPSAYLDGKRCLIEILEDDTVFFNCAPEAPAEILSPPAAVVPDNASLLGRQPSPPESL